ncbi:hypothetical protein E8E12_002188 [Didymella heteroderae]|uniref:Uncharacterized protein n=1 Tax=Didymella heteroderae TaxID=1769908 RepID=A0A9P4WKI6_9PLEO|nr:hypothetical protein E8E12_002188 [Didymella heteroderae]
MSCNLQTNAQKYDRQNAQSNRSGTSSSFANLNSASAYAMRSELRRCEGELKKTKEDLRKERHRYRSLEGTKNKLQTEHRQQKSDIENLQLDLKHLRYIDEDMCYFTNTYLRPYAQKRGVRLKDDTLVSYEAVLKPMFNDALQAHNLRSEVKNLQGHVQATEEEAEALQTRLAEAQVLSEESRALHDQVQSLQNEVQKLQRQLLAKVEKVRVVTDDAFDKDFRNLAAMVKSLGRSVKITKETNMSEALGNRGLLLDVQDHQWSTRARKKCFTEAWIWSVLLDCVFKTPFTVLGENGAAIAELWGKLFDNKHVRGWPNPSALCESWRRTTVEHAVAGMSQDMSLGTNNKAEGGLTDGAPPQELNDAELQMHNAVANEIGTRLANMSTAADFQLIPKVIEAAIALSLQMSLQRSRLQVTFPNVGDRFDRARMASMHDPDGEDMEDGVVAFIVRPGLTKWGNAHGKHFDQRHDIVHSLVQLEAHRGVEVKSEPM